ncbi:Vanillin dehydrogenase [Vanrija pseudolonga]|uniref:Vanillin dehydrogenase n=1 Tax=Vanrija pseudolonga TaxID=143232 RepID=A0AAF0YG46_9TREE|nr:Vanillin dehydrogenase [Vanrija pseudolonga]
MSSKVIPNLIGSTPAKVTATFDVVHPTEGVVHSVQRSTSADIEAAIATAHAALPSWRDTPLAERKAIVLRAADLLTDPNETWAQRLIDANVAETSSSVGWAQGLTGNTHNFMRALVEVADEALAPFEIKTNDSLCILTREPYGVCLAMAAWNAVQILTMRSTITPLLAGNTVVFKTSETTPYVQQIWAELLYAAGLPRDALTVVHVATEDAPALTEQLVSDKRIRHVNFTGSTRVGSIIAGLAGQNLKPVVMELGGKSGLLLLPDADIEIAASHIIAGAFLNAGQICMSTERVFVTASRYDELVAALRKDWAGYEKKQAHALFTARSAERVKDLVADAYAHGAADLIAEERTANGRGGNSLYPTILSPIDKSMRLYTEESFGPTLAIVVIPDEGRSEAEVLDDMVAQANDTEYGLSSSVWGRDTARAAQVAGRIECGAIHINGKTPADPPPVPHGGWKNSGWGRFNGVEGLRHFTHTRTIEIPDEHPGPLNLNGMDL